MSETLQNDLVRILVDKLIIGVIIVGVGYLVSRQTERFKSRQGAGGAGPRPTHVREQPQSCGCQTSGLRTTRPGNRLKSRSALHSSSTPWCRHRAAIRAS